MASLRSILFLVILFFCLFDESFSFKPKKPNRRKPSPKKPNPKKTIPKKPKHPNLPHTGHTPTHPKLPHTPTHPNLPQTPIHPNLSHPPTLWSPAVGTWYGSPDGCGSEGGSCGYGDLVSKPPWDSMITAVGPSLYQNGKECGACYQVKCSNHKSCSCQPVKVVVTDSCPGCSEPAHFDLSGKAFGAMALPGQCDELRNAGRLEIEYTRVPCEYPGTNIAFHVDQGSSAYYFAAVIEYEEGDGDIASVELRDSAGNGKWCVMQQSWGAVWKHDTGGLPLKPPLSLKVTSQLSGKTLLAENVIPADWKPGFSYRTVVKYL